MIVDSAPTSHTSSINKKIEGEFDPTQGAIYFVMTGSYDARGIEITIDSKSTAGLCFNLAATPTFNNQTCLPYNSFQQQTFDGPEYFIVIGPSPMFDSPNNALYSFSTSYDTYIYSMDLSFLGTLIMIGVTVVGFVVSLLISTALSAVGAAMLYQLPLYITVA